MAVTPAMVYDQAKLCLEELFQQDRAGLNPVRLLVVGASSSEISGGVLGHNSNYEFGEAVARSTLEMGRARGADLAFQCCEHLNRALIVERSLAERRGYEIVRVVPRLKAGGALATAAWKLFDDPVAVMSVQADAGLDIGLTLIGMHLRRVAVPLRLNNGHIGSAIIAAARTRPMLIGGERAIYEEDK